MTKPIEALHIAKHGNGHAPPTFDAIRAPFRERVFATQLVAFPGTDAPVRVRVLSEAEMDAARIDAIVYVKDRRVDTVVDRDEILDREVRRQVVHRAFVTSNDEGDDVPFIGSPSDLRENVDTATTDRLFEMYLDRQTQIAISTLPPAEEVDRILDTSIASKDETVDALLKMLDARALRGIVARAIVRMRENAKG
jgi:hypothetical protein